MINIINKKGVSYGKLQIITENETISGEDVLNRIQSIINILKAVNVDEIDKTDLFFLLTVLQDYLPNHEQMNAMFEVLNAKKTA